MGAGFDNVFIIADIEGSSGCRDYEASSFLTESWPSACLDMTRDVAAVTGALLSAGARSVIVKDFHRTGFNILPEFLDPRVRLVSGYLAGPVPGMGDPGPAGALMMIGMHAPSGTGGFLAHTLTSRIARLTVNGEPLSEAQLFAASLAPHGLSPVFFSGCPVACACAAGAIPGLSTWPIPKPRDDSSFDPASWREGLADAAVRSLDNREAAPYTMKGPFDVELARRDGEEAASKLAARWGFDRRGDTLFFGASDFDGLYRALIRICYMTPFVERILWAGLPLYNLMGHYGLFVARRRLRKRGLYPSGRAGLLTESRETVPGAGPART